MSSKNRKRLILIILAVLLIGGLGGLTAYYANLPENLSQHETLILGQSRFVPGSQAALRVAVRDSADGTPLENADINIRLQPATGGQAEVVYTGQTNTLGTADVSFTVPDVPNSDYVLIVDTRSRLGSDRVEQPVTLERDYRILLTTDKPLYQPGQIIHLRALALTAFDRQAAAAQAVEIRIADGKGNTVFRQTLTTSEFGVTAVDFQLADQVNTGPYAITAQMGNTSSQKTVTVERYSLPKFNITLTTEKSYYRPGETVRGSLNATYFFGKPVNDSTVTLEGFTFDFERQDSFTLQGTTDAQGNYAFEFILPTYIAGSDLEGGLGTFYLQTAVTDQTNHTENKGLSLPVTPNALIIEAIPEGGVFRSGIENLLYVLTSYPDGSPAQTRVQVTLSNQGTTEMAETGPYGLATIPLTPTDPWSDVLITASDAQGNTVERHFTFGGDYQEESVLLRPEKPAYRVGDTLILNLFTSAPSGAVYLDIVRDGQTVSTRAVEMQNGQAQVAIDLTPDLAGTLELHAYKILSYGAIVRDTRLVIVDEANDLAVTFQTDTPEYQPGETAVLQLQTSGSDGSGAQTAIGLAVVDEAVFALAAQDPGFAKLYFMLEQELLQPKYELHGFTIPDLILQPPVSDPTLLQAQEGAAQASLADTAVARTGPTLLANSREQTLARAYDRQNRYFTNLSNGLMGIMLILPIATIIISGIALWRDKRFWPSLGIGIGIILFFVLVASTGLLDLLFYNAEALIILLALMGVVSYFGLLIYAWREADKPMRWMVGLTLLFVLIFLASAWSASQGNVNMSENTILLILLVVFLHPLAFVWQAAGFGLARRGWLAAASSLLALLLLFVPLMGVAQSTRNFAPMAGGLGDGVVMEGEMMDLAMPMVATAETAPQEVKTAEESSGAAPRLRQFFPETMFWLPDGVTDTTGNLTVEIPVADSITTWRLTALASTQDGRLGSATGSLRVFQPFFVDLDLPLALTVGDEVSVPVGVFNYLPDAQTVRLDVQPENWFELLGPATQEITIAANDITVVYFPIRALQFGAQAFQVTALGSEMSDAIRKPVQVYPNGKEIRFSEADRLEVSAPVQTAVTIPTEAIPGTQGLTVKIYPGMVSQVVEGLDAILRMPSGCFEQTSSSAYPNVLVLDYLQTSGQISPEVQFKAEDYINIGYQRLTTYEVDGGGFSLFGDAPAVVLLTAYGVQEFSDMSRVFAVDESLIQRTAEWLLSQQNGDGSWGSEGWVEGTFISGPESDPVITTAYVLWSLGRAGYSSDGRFQTGLAYLRQKQATVTDPYALALIANALVTADNVGNQRDSTTTAVLDRLAQLAQFQGDSAYWGVADSTFMGGYGQAGNLETTALATLSFIYSNSHPDLANKGMLYLIQNKDSFGNWETTQATILSLQAFIASARLASQNINATVTVTLNNGQSRTVQITPDNFDVVQLVTFDDVALGDNVIRIEAQGEGSLMYQVAGSYYLPWERLPDYPDLMPAQELVAVDVQYDRTELTVDDSVRVDVTVSLAEGRADWALVDLGLPPGFAVNSEDLAALVAQFNQIGSEYSGATIQRYELTGRQILVYLGNLTAGEPFRFSYRLTARFPLRAQTPASNAYDYYNPAVSGEAAPQILTVGGG